ncbi:glycosyltransferase family 4 protein [Wenyingzhuangia sp. 1_MG-2023]|nr:glycosyltransferase family 4 protein [Wenyingzhuangia sp. 1_MG-2023]
MKINIASFGGRTHMLDTAKELEKFGHEVRFYSFVPTKRAVKFGLKKECNKSYFFLAMPFLALQKVTRRSFWSVYLFHRFFDFYVGMIMPSCDVFIGQSPLHVFALKRAKKSFKAITILERGSSHILTMIKILKTIPTNKDKDVMPSMFIKRDLKGYEIADFISIASDFQKRSFIENKISLCKLLINPYGVSTASFYPTEKPLKDSYDAIMVGQWSYRKGCDLIVEAVKRMGISFLHVGGFKDLEFPKGENFTHIDSVNQSELVEFYKKAKIFVMPSREDGFGMVISQALICGLPIVCSRNTGAYSLVHFLEDEKWMIEMPEYSVECLVESIKKALKLWESQPEGERNYANNAVKELTWEKYGERYNKNIELIVRKENVVE